MSRRLVDGVLLLWIWRSNRWRLLLVAAGLVIWGALMPGIYATFGADFKVLVDTGIIPTPLLQFVGGNVLTLGSAVALGVIHPIAVFLKALFPVGHGLTSVAGERQRGTLEVLLARPLDRRTLHLTHLTAIAIFSVVGVTAELLGTIIGSAAFGVLGELPLGRFPLLWLDGVALYISLGAIALGASVSSDRLAPAATAALVLLVVSFVLEILAELWPDARGLGPWSIFHYLDARSILAGDGHPGDVLVLAVVVAAAVGYAQLIFPRRDLAAPA